MAQGVGGVADPVPAADSDIPSRFRVVATSSTLITFILIIGLACVLVLFGTLTQSRMSTLTIDGVAINIWKLDDIRKHWSDIRQQLLDQADDLSAAESDLESAQKTSAETETKLRPQGKALETQLETFYFRILPIVPNLADAIHNQNYPQQTGRINAAKDELGSHPELQPLIDRINEVDKIYEPLSEQSVRDKEAVAAAQQKVKQIADRTTSLQTALDGMFTDSSSKQPLSKATRNQVENALYELYSEEGRVGWILNKTITTPPDILTLFLVILMGVLGSALQMTHALFTKNQVEGPGAYCLRLSVGAITALVIFIVAKAGVPVIADASQLGGNAAINPYFISFLAIISGLMSENAIVSVERQGQRFFGQDMTKDQPRWARVDLHDDFAKAGRDPKATMQLLNTPEDQFNAWISGKDAMPLNAQMITAAVLGMSLRDIFTDIGPDGVPPARAS